MPRLLTVVPGCRLPGQASNPRAFWDLISAGQSATGQVPASRFNLNGFYHPKGSERAGSMNTEGGYFLDEDTRQFENSFFNINNLGESLILRTIPRAFS